MMPTNRTRRSRANIGPTPEWARALLAGEPFDQDDPEFNHWFLLAGYQVPGLPLANSSEGEALLKGVGQ